ncbi:hypothetical protein T492DRAFT_1068646 [Pavlovales sp. CCMP2436]|nr:hypothetical protein T492DRAFT_1068646 [Pavlovales sp. CCMP2436]|mmetsp:Transcript_3917/g.9941  ORF Transcript_3917/g.9941 Transcript_3917/m.9941 type:complete len:338 (+) Transcript_3917:18-1031(+)
MPPKKAVKKAGAKGGKKDKGPEVDPAEVVVQFQKHYVRLAKDRGLDPLRLGSAEDNGVLSTEAVFTKVALHPLMPGPACDLPQLMTALDALAFYRFLRHLCVWRVPLAEEGSARLGRFLSASKTVARVELLDCNINTGGCAHVAAALQSNVILTRLSLDHNPIGESGVTALRAALEKNGSLQSLSLRFCGVQPGGAEALARLIAACKLRDLDLQGNQLETLGACRCLEALRENVSLARIGLACTSWGADNAVTQALLETIEQNKTCNEYNIGGNPIGNANAIKLAAALRSTPHVTGLVTTDQLTPAIFHEIAKLADANLKEMLKRNKKKKGGKKKKK